MSAPYVGGPEPLESPTGKCGYRLQEGAPRCEDAADLHLLVADETWGFVALSACWAHAGFARSCAYVVQEHRCGLFCGFPGSRWSPTRNECVLDDSGCSGLDQEALTANAPRLPRGGTIYGGG